MSLKKKVQVYLYTEHEGVEILTLIDCITRFLSSLVKVYQQLLMLQCVSHQATIQHIIKIPDAQLYLNCSL